MLPKHLFKLEEEALQSLLTVSNHGKSKANFLPSITKPTQATLKSYHDVFSPWTDDNYTETLQSNCVGKSQAHLSKLFPAVELSHTMANKLKEESKRPTVKFQHKTKNSPFYETKFFHFEDIRDYIREYRENTTLPPIMEYRKSLLVNCADKTIGIDCTTSCNPYDLIKQCQCLKSTKRSSPNASSVCYGTENEMCRFLQEEKEKKGDTVTMGIKTKQFYECIERKTVSRNKKNEKSPNNKSKKEVSNYNNKFCSTMKFCKKDKTKTKYHRDILRIKTGNETPNPLKILPKPNAAIGPRMGSNYPPDYKDGNRQGTPSQRLMRSLRPKVPQAAIPGRRSSFQACIMPMTVTSNKFQTNKIKY